jgi:hypothetical protein
MPPPKDETEDQKAIRLAKAKKQAAKSREEKMVEKYKDKVLEKEKKKQVKDESESEDEDEEAPKKPLKPVKPIKEEVTEEVKEEEEKPKPKIKVKAKAKAKVIIEQDSSDDEVFEASKDVIFVKRVRAKKVEQQHAPQSDNRSASTPMPPSVATNPVTRQEQPLPQRFQQQQQQQQAPPPKPQMSQEKRLEMERYLNMTRGNFLPISRPR